MAATGNILVSRALHLPTWLTKMVDLYEFSGYARAMASARYNWFMSAVNVYQSVDQFGWLHHYFCATDVGFTQLRYPGRRISSKPT
jgi:hypothetical protein